ncbi:hypothetical protein LCGC14_2998930, partial [marine sediment metagenome]
MLLKIMVLTWDISSNLSSIGKADTGDFSQSGVWLLRRHGAYIKADTSSLRATGQVDGFPLAGCFSSGASDKLIYGRHKQYSVLDFAEGISQSLIEDLFRDLNLDGLWWRSQMLYGHVEIGLD